MAHLVLRRVLTLFSSRLQPTLRSTYIHILFLSIDMAMMGSLRGLYRHDDILRNIDDAKYRHRIDFKKSITAHHYSQRVTRIKLVLFIHALIETQSVRVTYTFHEAIIIPHCNPVATCLFPRLFCAYKRQLCVYSIDDMRKTSRRLFVGRWELSLLQIT